MTTKQLVTGALLSAFTLVILYLTFLIPTNTLTLLTLASVMVPIALIRCNLKTCWLVYITSGVLSLIFLPINISMLYILFFGVYGIIKYFIEKLNQLPLEWILKYLFFNIIFFIGFKFTTTLINPNAFNGLMNLAKQFLPNIPYNAFLILIIIGQVAFAVYDYALTLLIDTYYTYVSKY